MCEKSRSQTNIHMDVNLRLRLQAIEARSGGASTLYPISDSDIMNRNSALL